MTLTHGQSLKERYWIANLVERGGFGAVYKAWDIVLNRPCALKESYEDSVEGQRQFLREAQILANLTHPNLPRVTDFFTIPEQGQYLVMDFVEGMNLEELRVLTGGRLPEAQALGWIAQVLDALNYMHRQDPPVIHRDIKPTNIKVAPADENYPQGRAVLVDFGVAKAYDPGKRTTMGARMVTPGYSPHEQYGQSGVLTDARTDIYALGATLYMLLTGHEPPESVIRLLRDPLVPPRQLNPELSEAVEAIILKAMHNDPEERFQSASEFRAAVRGLLAGEGSRQMVAGSQKPVEGNQPPAVVVEPPSPPLPAQPLNAIQSPALQPVAQPVRGAQAPDPQPVVPGAAAGPALGQARQLGGQAPVTASGVPVGAGAQGGSPPLTPPAGMGSGAKAGSSLWKKLGLGIMMAIAVAIVAMLVNGQIQQNKWYAAQTARAEYTQTANVRGTQTAQAGYTQAAIVIGTQTAQAEYTQAANVMGTQTAKTVSQLLAGYQTSANLLKGPLNGELIHQDDDYIETAYIQGEITNFILEVVFENPYASSAHRWDFGVVFRDTGGADQFYLWIESRGHWGLMNRTGEPNGQTIASGQLNNLNRGEGEENHLTLAAIGEVGYLFINEAFIAELDLSSRLFPGSVKVATGMQRGDEVDGEITVYRSLYLWGLDE